MSHNTPAAWGICDGSAGMISQLRGLFEALDIPYTLKRCVRRKPGVWMPNALVKDPLKQLKDGSDPLNPPWPRLVVTCGRRSAPLALAIKQASGGATNAGHIGNPQGRNREYDLIIAMLHDRLYGSNVVDTRFALHPITTEMLARERERFLTRAIGLQRPLVAYLIGGSTNKYRLSRKRMIDVIAVIEQLLIHTSATVMVTASRRTGAANEAMLKERYKGYKRVWIAERGENNPYLGFLAVADAIVVTNDSVNMMSEAAATGKPLYIVPLPGHQHTKPERFGRMLIEENIARVFRTPLEEWHYSSAIEASAVARTIREKLKL